MLYDTYLANKEEPCWKDGHITNENSETAVCKSRNDASRCFNHTPAAKLDVPDHGGMVKIF